MSSPITASAGPVELSKANKHTQSRRQQRKRAAAARMEQGESAVATRVVQAERPSVARLQADIEQGDHVPSHRVEAPVKSAMTLQKYRSAPMAPRRSVRHGSPSPPPKRVCFDAHALGKRKTIIGMVPRLATPDLSRQGCALSTDPATAAEDGWWIGRAGGGLWPDRIIL